MPAVGAFSITLPVTAVSASTAMPMPAPSPGSVPAGRFGRQVADDVAVHDREPSALVEIGDRDADRSAVDGVVRDQRALEAELRIERDLAHVGDAVAFDLEVRGGIAAHRRERAVADAVAAHDHIGGAEYVDGVAVLAGAAGAVVDRLDAVVDDHGAVVAGSAAPDLDAVVAGAGNGVARDQQRARIEGMDRDVGAVGQDRVDDLAVDRGAGDGGAAGAEDFAIGDLDAADVLEMHEAAPLGQAAALAVERRGPTA